MAALLHGCIVSTSGYTPTGPGRVERNFCVPNIKDTVRIRLSRGVEVMVRAGLDIFRVGEINLYTALIIPKGVSVRLLSPDLLLESPGWPEPKTLSILEIRAPGLYGVQGSTFQPRNCPARTGETSSP